MVSRGLLDSSEVYKTLRDGIAMKINMIVGTEVQNNSSSCLSDVNRLNEFDISDEDIK